MAREKYIVDSQAFILNDNTPFTVQEAYKGLRSNIMFSLLGKENFCIGFTSSSRGEAKSTTAMNVAISFGQLGRKVILVDCDLRLPTIASKLGIKGTPGLSDLIVGQCKFSEAAKRVEDYEIDVLPAGNIPPDATRLIQSKQMQNVIESLKKYYEVVIFDLPPVATVTDAAILGASLDGFCLLVRHDHSDLKEIREMVDQMKRANANILGFVYSGAPVSQKKYYSYYKK